MLLAKLVAMWVWSFPTGASVAGNLYRAPDGNVVGLVEFPDGRLMRLLDGFKGRGTWCAEVARVDSMDVVCGTGEVLRHSQGWRVRMEGPGVSINDVAVRGVW